MNNTEVAGLDWSTGKLLPGFQMPEQLTIYDIRQASQENVLSVTTLVGLINRPKPRIYLIVSDDDIFWMNKIFHTLQPATSSSTGNDVFNALLDIYSDIVQGMIIYDPALIDSINVATTMAGQRDALVVSPTQATSLQQARGFKVLDDLGTYQWKSRSQAYEWARQHLLDGASKRLVAGLDPTNAAGLRSFLTATRTFIYWLDSRNIVPDPTNQLHTERGLMQQILGAYPEGAAHLGWFFDEKSGVNLTSQAGIPALASDIFFNLEVWTSVRPPAMPTIPPLTVPQIDNSKVYVSFTMSDGDNLQYSQHRMHNRWDDPAHGSIPTGWTISPVLVQDIPVLASYYVQNATPNDELIAGPSGAGYMFPSQWPAERLPGFLQLTGRLMQTMGLNILELLDADIFERNGIPYVSGLINIGKAIIDDELLSQIVHGLTSFGLKGILNGEGIAQASWSVNNGTPIYRNMGFASSVDQTVSLIRNAATARSERPLFLSVYVSVWDMTPTMLKQVVQQLGSDYTIVTPGVLLSMLAHAGKQSA